MPTLPLDDRDLAILAILTREGRLSKAELARRVNLSPTPCWQRLARMEGAGLIRGYRAEIALAARERLGTGIGLFWIGDPRHLPAGARWEPIATPAEAARVPGAVLPVLAHPFPHPARPGAPDPRNAAAVIEVISRAVDFLRGGEASAVCTLPISKKVLRDGAAFGFPGHTEYLAALAGGARSESAPAA